MVAVPTLAAAQRAYQWNGGSGDWSTATNWTPRGLLLVGGDYANITAADGIGFEVNYDYSGTAATLSLPTVNLTGGPAAAGGLLPVLSVGYADGNIDTGTAAGPNQIIVAYTLAGDANLDGQVNFADLLIVSDNYHKTGMDWSQGNFTYDPNGMVGFEDLLLVVQNFTQTLTPAANWVETDDAVSRPSAHLSAADATVPEPGGVAVAAIGGVALMARRRKIKGNPPEPLKS
jgi:hypothetical protein